MAKNWLQKVEDEIKRERKTSAIHYRNATEMSENIRKKYKCGLADLPMNKLTDKEKNIVFKAWLQLGYSEESASLIVYNNIYQYKLL